MNKVLFFTQAYNSQKTLARTIDSVLAQTHTDFQYYVLDNDSSDDTGAIIRRYAAKDARIVPLKNKVNLRGYWYFHPGLIGNPEFSDDDFWCILDDDDEYQPDFLEKTLAFANEHRLDIAASGYTAVDARTRQSVVAVVKDRNLVIKDAGFANLPVYHDFFSMPWAKLFRLGLLRKMDPPLRFEWYHGNDVVWNYRILRDAKTIGVFGESLHTYYRADKSTSPTYRLDADRIAALTWMFDAARDFLIEKCGKCSPENEAFLFLNYAARLNSSYALVMRASISLAEKLDKLAELFLCERSRQCFERASSGQLGEASRNRLENCLWSLTDYLLIQPRIPPEALGRYRELSEWAKIDRDTADRFLSVVQGTPETPPPPPSLADGTIAKKIAPREQTLKTALSLFALARFPAAEFLSCQQIEKNARNEDATALCAYAVFRQDRFNEAAALMQTALSLNPAKAVYYADLGVMLLSAKRYDEAEVQLRMARILDPKNADIAFAFALALGYQGKTGAGIEAFDALVNAHPELATRVCGIRALLLEHRLDEAKALFEQSDAPPDAALAIPGAFGVMDMVARWSVALPRAVGETTVELQFNSEP